jgi:hypothetical protein
MNGMTPRKSGSVERDAARPPPDPPAAADAAPTPAEAEATAPEAALPAILGHIDGLDMHRRISGWACLPGGAAPPVRVDVLDGDDLVVSGLADELREDVRAAGHGDGLCGFTLSLPERLLDGRPHRITIRCEAPEAQPFVAELMLDLPIHVPAAGGAAARPQLELPVVEDRLAAGYTPGQYVACTRPHGLPPYHIRGWHEPEDEFTWIDGIEGVLEMAIHRPARSYTLLLDVVPNGVGNRLQTLEVFFNYLRAGFFEVPAPAMLSIELPAELFILRKTRINLHCGQALVGAEYGIPDARRLGIALRGWCIG